MIVISACLAGEKCRYDGKDNKINQFYELVKQNEAIVVCPEVLGGLSTPREPAEIKGGTALDVLSGKAKVITKSGKDVTKAFVKGAYETLEIVKQAGVKTVVLKESSPSCGSEWVYDGTFLNRKIEGEGITSALLRKHGIKVYSEKNDSFLNKGRIEKE